MGSVVTLVRFGVVAVCLGCAALSVFAADVPIRFRDSATGFAVQPDSVAARAADASVRRWVDQDLGRDGRGQLALPSGRHQLSIAARGYHSLPGELVVNDTSYRLEFHLDPLEVPREIQPEALARLHRVNETVFVSPGCSATLVNAFSSLGGRVNEDSTSRT